MRICASCKELKPDEAFSWKDTIHTKRYPRCKSCKNKESKLRYWRIKDRRLKQCKEYRQKLHRLYDTLKIGLVCKNCGEDDLSIICCYDENNKSIVTSLNKGMGKNTLINKMHACIPLCYRCLPRRKPGGAWSRGLTKATNSSLAKAGLKISKLQKGKSPWDIWCIVMPKENSK